MSDFKTRCSCGAEFEFTDVVVNSRMIEESVFGRLLSEWKRVHDGCAKRPVVPDKDWSRTSFSPTTVRRSVWDEKNQALRDQGGIKPCLEYEAFLPPHDLRCRNCGMHPEVHQ